MPCRKLLRPAMPGAGRPVSDDPRRFVLRFMVTESERDRYMGAAAEQVQSLSEWVREQCELAVARRSTR